MTHVWRKQSGDCVTFARMSKANMVSAQNSVANIVSDEEELKRFLYLYHVLIAQEHKLFACLAYRIVMKARDHPRV